MPKIIKLAVDMLSQLTGVQSTSYYTNDFIIFIPLSAPRSSANDKNITKAIINQSS